MDTRADIELFIFLIKQEEKNDMQYKFIAKTDLLISANKKESSNKLVWSGLLDKGVYVLIPSTTGCIFTKRKIQPSSDIHLTEIDDLTGKSKYWWPIKYNTANGQFHEILVKYHKKYDKLYYYYWQCFIVNLLLKQTFREIAWVIFIY